MSGIMGQMRAVRSAPAVPSQRPSGLTAGSLLDEQDEVIVRSTIDLGHNLGLVVVAEGAQDKY